MPPFPFPLRLLLTTGTLLTWLPALSFLFNHVGRTATVDGRSMSPFLNTDYQTTGLKRDRVWLSLWDPSTGVRRGMVVAFWYVLWGRGEGRVDGAGLDAGNRGEGGN
jgi:signal peptidase I